MEAETRNFLATLIVAAVISGGVAWTYEKIKAYLGRARLEIDSCEIHDDEGRRYFYLTVTNRGQTTARACVAQLTIHLKHWDRVLPGGHFNPSSMVGHGTAGLNNITTVWQRATRPIEVSIHPLQSQRLELATASMSDDEWVFTVAGDAGYDRPHIRFGGGGFEYIARVGSDNAGPVLCFGQVLNAGQHPPTLEISSAPTQAFAWKPPSLVTRIRHVAVPRRSSGWWVLGLSVLSLAAWIVLPMIAVLFRDTYPITDTWVMTATGAVLLDLAAVLNLLCIWRWKERSILNVIVAVFTIPVALFATVMLVGMGGMFK